MMGLGSGYGILRVSFLGLLFSGMAPAAPPAKLSETALYTNILEKTLSTKLRAFSPQYALWTDGAEKDRWILIPEGTQINTSDLDRWIFPVGTQVFKEFRFRELQTGLPKRVETRFMQKTETQWEFGTYVWNAEETEATLAGAPGLKNHYPITAELKHDIPSLADCRSCHRTGGDPVLGFDLLQLSRDRDPLALHAKVPFEGLNLDSLNSEGLLTNYPETLATNPPRIHARNPQGRAAMGYLYANCASCHRENGAAGHTDLWMRHLSTNQSEAEEAAFASTVGVPTTGFTIPGEDLSLRITPGNPDKSTIFYRLQASGFERMPPRGTKLHDIEGIAAIRQWIESLQ